MADQTDEYKQFILSADQRALVRQLGMDIKGPLASAQNIVNMLKMIQNPSPAIQSKMESGELNPADMLEQLSGLIYQVFDVLEFYRDTLDEQ
jgi:hypothetical protein